MNNTETVAFLLLLCVSIEQSVIELKREHDATWRDKPDWFWMLMLLEEIYELALALAGLHRHSPDLELRQISSICLNWMEKRRAEGRDRE